MSELPPKPVTAVEVFFAGLTLPLWVLFGLSYCTERVMQPQHKQCVQKGGIVMETSLPKFSVVCMRPDAVIPYDSTGKR